MWRKTLEVCAYIYKVHGDAEAANPSGPCSCLPRKTDYECEWTQVTTASTARKQNHTPILCGPCTSYFVLSNSVSAQGVVLIRVIVAYLTCVDERSNSAACKHSLVCAHLGRDGYTDKRCDLFNERYSIVFQFLHSRHAVPSKNSKCAVTLYK